MDYMFRFWHTLLQLSLDKRARLRSKKSTTLYSSSDDEYSDNRFAESAAFRDVRVTFTSKGNKHSML